MARKAAKSEDNPIFISHFFVVFFFLKDIFLSGPGMPMVMMFFLGVFCSLRGEGIFLGWGCWDLTLKRGSAPCRVGLPRGFFEFSS
jgi:hypothetical protein